MHLNELKVFIDSYNPGHNLFTTQLNKYSIDYCW